jgi:hypothetical protein
MTQYALKADRHPKRKLTCTEREARVRALLSRLCVLLDKFDATISDGQLVCFDGTGNDPRYHTLAFVNGGDARAYRLPREPAVEIFVDGPWRKQSRKSRRRVSR